MNLAKKQKRAVSFFLFLFFTATLSSVSFAEMPVKGRDNLAIFITGLSGGSQFEIHMQSAVLSCRKVLRINGYSNKQMAFFSESPESSMEWGRNERAEKDKITEFLTDTGKRQKPYDQVFVFIAGHANGRDEEAMFHLPEDDMIYQSLISGIDGIPANEMIVVVMASQGQTWIKKLSRSGRVIIAGNGLRQFDFIPMLFLRVFPRNLLHGIRTPVQTNQKTFKISLRDVFMESQKEVQGWYRRVNLHPTEVALIDADGNGKGQTLISKGVQFDEWAAGERKAADVLGSMIDSLPVPGSEAVSPQVLAAHPEVVPGLEGDKTPGDSSDLYVELPMDPDLPDARAAEAFTFTVPGGKPHGH